MAGKNASNPAKDTARVRLKVSCLYSHTVEPQRGQVAFSPAFSVGRVINASQSGQARKSLDIPWLECFISTKNSAF